MIQSITRYPDVRSPSNHHIVAACTCCAHCNINERNLSTHSDMDIRRIKDAQKTKTKLTVRNAIVRTSCARSFKHCFFDYYASHHHVLRLFPPYRPPTWSLVVTKSSAVNHCLLGSDAPCPMNMSLTGPIFFYYVNMMIIDWINTDLVSIGVNQCVLYDLNKNKTFLTSRKTDFFSWAYIAQHSDNMTNRRRQFSD